MEVKVFEGLKAGNEVLTQLNKLMDVNEVEKLMLDTEDAIAYQQVSALLSLCNLTTFLLRVAAMPRRIRLLFGIDCSFFFISLFPFPFFFLFLFSFCLRRKSVPSLAPN